MSEIDIDALKEAADAADAADAARQEVLGTATIESDNEFFAKAGPLPAHWDDGRRHPRFYYRSRMQALIYPAKDGPSAPPTACVMLTRDLSRGGINVLHTEQLFPGQRIDIKLADGVARSVRISWCRRIANRCYSAGGQFVRSDDWGEAQGETPSP